MLDPVTVGGVVVGDNQPNRKVITVENNPHSHAHSFISLLDTADDGLYWGQMSTHEPLLLWHSREGCLSSAC